MGGRAAWLIFSKDVRAQVRNRTIFILGLLAPLALAFVLNLVFSGSDAPAAQVSFPIGLANPDDSAPGSFSRVLRDFPSDGLLDVRPYEDEAAARAAVERGEIGAAWVLSEGFPGGRSGGPPPEIVVIGDVDAPNTVSVARAIAGRYALGRGTVDLAVRVALETGAVAARDVRALAAEVATAPPAAVLTPIRAEAAEVLDLTTSLTAGLALFFGFFIAGLPLTSLLEERSGETLGRLLVAPVPSGAIVAGKALAGVVIGVASLATLMIASAALMGAEWGPPFGALLLATAFLVAAVGLMTAAGSAAKTAEQASGAQGIVAMGLGLLGGAFVPIPATESSFLGRVREVTPHGWFLQGLTDLRSDGIAAALPSAGALLAIGVAFGIVGMAASYRALRR